MLNILIILISGCTEDKISKLGIKTKNPNSTEIVFLNSGTNYNTTTSISYSDKGVSAATLLSFQNGFCVGATKRNSQSRSENLIMCWNNFDNLIQYPYNFANIETSNLLKTFYSTLSDKSLLMISNHVDGSTYRIVKLTNNGINVVENGNSLIFPGDDNIREIKDLISTDNSNTFYIVFFRHNGLNNESYICVRAMEFDNNNSWNYNFIGSEVIIDSLIYTGINNPSPTNIYPFNNNMFYRGLNFEDKLLISYSIQRRDDTQAQDIDYVLIGKDSNGNLTSIVETGALNNRNAGKEKDQVLVKYDTNKFILTYTGSLAKPGNDGTPERAVYVRGFGINNGVEVIAEEVRLTTLASGSEYFPQTYYIEEAEAFVTFFYYETSTPGKYDILGRFFKVEEGNIVFLTETLVLKENVWPNGLTNRIDTDSEEDYYVQPKISFIYDASQNSNVLNIDAKMSYYVMPESSGDRNNVADLGLLFNVTITVEYPTTTTTTTTTATTTTTTGTTTSTTTTTTTPTTITTTTVTTPTTTTTIPTTTTLETTPSTTTTPETTVTTTTTNDPTTTTATTTTVTTPTTTTTISTTTTLETTPSTTTTPETTATTTTTNDPTTTTTTTTTTPANVANADESKSGSSGGTDGTILYGAAAVGGVGLLAGAYLLVKKMFGSISRGNVEAGNRDLSTITNRTDTGEELYEEIGPDVNVRRLAELTGNDGYEKPVTFNSEYGKTNTYDTPADANQAVYDLANQGNGSEVVATEYEPLETKVNNIEEPTILEDGTAIYSLGNNIGDSVTDEPGTTETSIDEKERTLRSREGSNSSRITEIDFGFEGEVRTDSYLEVGTSEESNTSNDMLENQTYDNLQKGDYVTVSEQEEQPNEITIYDTAKVNEDEQEGFYDVGPDTEEVYDNPKFVDTLKK